MRSPRSPTRQFEEQLYRLYAQAMAQRLRRKTKTNQYAITKALNAKRESKFIEFKSEFDISSKGAWCEIIKDMVAIANSGGGVIVIGLTSGGRLANSNFAQLSNLDSADITDKIFSYTGHHFSSFEIEEANKDGHLVTAIVIEAADVPIVFTNPGTYLVADGKQKTAFGRGTLYFRHGAKSETASSNDLQVFFQKQLDLIRRDWMSGLRTVTEAPLGSAITVLSREVLETLDPSATPIRIVDDPSAPAYRQINNDDKYPYRQKELVQAVQERLAANSAFNSHDVQAIRKTNAAANADRFVYKPKFGSPQYSKDFVDWIVQQYQKDQKFFSNARAYLRRKVYK